ncbi:MAG: hypothetical protein ACI8W8_000065 [Rhodothermales bacterium]|jgi:hypothetical protein
MKFFLSISLLLVLCANSAELPPTDSLKAEIEAELKKKVESRIEPKSLALKYRLPIPVLPPTMSRDEIEQRIAAEVGRQSQEEFPNRDEEFAVAAAKKFPLVNVRDELSVQVKRGGVMKGVLYANESSFIKVSSYRINKVDLVPQSLALVDEKENATQRKRYIYKERQMVAVAQERLTDAIQDDFGKGLFIKHGYMSRQGKWIAQNELLDAAIAHETRLLRQKYGPHIKKAILEKYGYTLVQGRWKRPEPEVVAVAEPAAARPAVSPVVSLPPSTPPEAVAMLEKAARERGKPGRWGQERVKAAAPPPPPQGDWSWGLPSKPYSLARDKDIPSREQLWKLEMDRPESAERHRGRHYGYGAANTVDVAYPDYKGTGTLRRSFFQVK